MRHGKRSPVPPEAMRLAGELKDSQNRFDDAWQAGRLRMSLAERLEALNITMEDTLWLMDTFGPTGSSFLQMKFAENFGRRGTMDPRRWTQVNRPGGIPVPLREGRILLDHFLHRRRVLSTRRCRKQQTWQKSPDGTVTPETTRVSDQIIFDLDVHSAEAAGTLRKRYTQIRELTTVMPLVFRTSLSQGLQVVFWLPRWRRVEEILRYAEQQLRMVGLRLRSGHIEVFPRAFGHIRVPLGPHGAMLDPDTLEPMDLPFAELLKLIKATKANHKAGDYHLGRLESRPKSERIEVLREDLSNAAPVVAQELSPTSNEAGPTCNHDRQVDEETYVQGLSPDVPRYEALPMVIRHTYFVLGIHDKTALAGHVEEWLADNHKGQSSRYLTDRTQVLADIRRLVSKHLDYVKTRGSHGQPRYDQGKHLFLPDYKEIAKLALLVQKHLGPDVPLSRIQKGLSELFLYVKRKAGGETQSPAVPLSHNTMARRFRYWSTNPQTSHYYRYWLQALDDLGILNLEDRRTAQGKCRRYRLHHTFIESGRPIENEEHGLALAEGNPDEQDTPRYSAAKPMHLWCTSLCLDKWKPKETGSGVGPGGRAL